MTSEQLIKEWLDSHKYVYYNKDCSFDSVTLDGNFNLLDLLNRFIDQEIERKNGMKKKLPKIKEFPEKYKDNMEINSETIPIAMHNAIAMNYIGSFEYGYNQATTIKDKFNEICSYQSSNFKEWFGDIKYVGENHELFSKKLGTSMNNEEILNTLKPEPVLLGNVFNHVKTMNRDIYAIFYCKDKNGVLRAVRVHWYFDGWLVDADSVENPFRWRDGSQVFSRNFGTLSLEDRVKALEDKLQKIKELI